MAIDKTEAGLTEFLKKRVLDRWNEESAPYMLSSLPIDLRPESVDYKEILGDERLKAFVKRTEGADLYRVVEHPNQKAKVGLVPHGADFEFQLDIIPKDAQHSSEQPSIREDRARVVIDFLNALGKLDDKDLSEVVIPARVLVNLISRR